jgi:tryptophan synthase alpha chain
MNRIDVTLTSLRGANRVGLFPYLMAGYPTLDSSEALALAALEAGAHGLEIGVPFSDPVADGATFQHAGQVALRNGASLPWALGLVQRLRSRTEAPLILMTYYNPIFRYGLPQFVADAARIGLDAAIVPDLPYSEATPLIREAEARDLYLIQMIAPTSTDARLKEVGRSAKGFVYCVSLLGTTGARAQLSERLPGCLQRVRAYVSQPLLVGFGIARPEHILGLRSAGGDACVVASAIADLLEDTAPERREGALRAFVGQLRAACDPPADPAPPS